MRMRACVRVLGRGGARARAGACARLGLTSMLRAGAIFSASFLVPTYFSILSCNGMIFENKLLNIKCFNFFYNIYLKNFSL